MTDEIRITRRVALEKYEFYEIEWTTNKRDCDAVFELIEEKVRFIKINYGEPSPEISHRTDTGVIEPMVYDLTQAGIDPSILEFKGNTARLKTYQKDKTIWEKIHFVLKEAGYRWVADGKESRWER